MHDDESEEHNNNIAHQTSPPRLVLPPPTIHNTYFTNAQHLPPTSALLFGMSFPVARTRSFRE